MTSLMRVAGICGHCGFLEMFHMVDDLTLWNNERDEKIIRKQYQMDSLRERGWDMTNPSSPRCNRCIGKKNNLDLNLKIVTIGDRILPDGKYDYAEWASLGIN